MSAASFTMAGVWQGRLRRVGDASTERGVVTRRAMLPKAKTSESFADVWFANDAVLDIILVFLGPSWLLAGSVCKKWREAVLRSSTQKQTSYRRALESISTYDYAVPSCVSRRLCHSIMPGMALAMGKYASQALITHQSHFTCSECSYNLREGAVCSDRLDLLLWLRQRSGFSKSCKFYVPEMWDAARLGSADCFIWFVTHGLHNMNHLRNIHKHKFSSLAAAGGSARILEYLQKQNLLSAPADCLKPHCCLITAAARRGHTAAVVWLYERGYPVGERACAGAAVGGHLELLQWMRAHGAPWDERYIVDQALQGGSLAFLEWLKTEGSMQGELDQLVAKACRRDNLQLAEWLRTECRAHMPAVPWKAPNSVWPLR
jgi:hypothetical protein